MRQRAFIHVGGACGAGKTALVEALLARTDHMINVVRCVHDDTLQDPRERFTKTDPELHRYLTAGAHAVARYTFPGSSDAHDMFFQTDVMQDFSHAVPIEGDCPVSLVDVSVHVAPATAGPLLVRRESDQPGRHREAVDTLEAALSRPGGLEAMLGELIGPGLAAFARQHPELVEQQRRTALTQLAEVRGRPETKRPMRWAVADAYHGIEQAQLVVVNLHDDTEKVAGEALLAEVARLRNDSDVFTEVMGPRGNRIPITAVTANLTQSVDPGTKKALKRIQRVIRANS